MPCSGGMCTIGNQSLNGNLPGKPSLFRGSPAGVQQLSRYSPQNQNIMQQLLGLARQRLPQLFRQQGVQVPGALQNLQNFTPFNFADIEKKARSGFAQQTVPTLAERSTSLGDNALSSPAFASQLGQAGAGLEESLAGLKSQIGLSEQARQQQLAMQLLGLQTQTGQSEKGRIQGLLGTLLGLGLQPNENLYQPAQPSRAESWLGKLLPVAGQVAGGYLAGGGAGAAASLLGNAVGNIGQQAQPQNQMGQFNYGSPYAGNLYGGGFNNPNTYSSGLQNLNRGF